MENKITVINITDNDNQPQTPARINDHVICRICYDGTYLNTFNKIKKTYFLLKKFVKYFVT